MSSENVTSGDNQQETERTTLELDPHWVAGFVDGEGCFSVSVHRSPSVRRTAWQLQASFQVYQHEASRAVLEDIAVFFGCGRIRPKGPKSSVLTYSVWNLGELEEHVLPVFERYTLRVKGEDFRKFAEIVRSQRRKDHLDPGGLERIARLAYSMNAHGKQRARTIDEVLEGSSETVRQASFDLRG